MWRVSIFFLREIKKNISQRNKKNISLRILVWRVSIFFLREIKKKYFSKDFGVGGSDFFSLEK